MELLRGESLGARLASGRRLGVQQAVEILRQLAVVLEKTHAAGVVHRDLKPDNLFLCEKEDGTVRVKVLDFGIAKMVQQASKSRNTVNIGTPLYMAPEQIDGGRIDRRADVYSLGHVAYEILTGESYWEDELRRAPSTLVLLRWMEGPLPEPPSLRASRRGVAVGPAFDGWFAKATSRRAADRHANATELVAELVTALGAGFPLLPAPTDTDALTRVRQSPLEEAPVSVGQAAAPLRFDSSWGETPPIQTVRDPPPRTQRGPLALLAVTGAAAALAVAALLLTLAGGSASAPSEDAATASAGLAAPGPSVATVIIPVPVSVESAAPSVSAAGKPTAAPSVKATPIKPAPRRTEQRCKREPERCR